jgi:hypothetical protein
VMFDDARAVRVDVAMAKTGDIADAVLERTREEGGRDRRENTEKAGVSYSRRASARVPSSQLEEVASSAMIATGRGGRPEKQRRGGTAAAADTKRTRHTLALLLLTNEASQHLFESRSNPGQGQ